MNEKRFKNGNLFQNGDTLKGDTIECEARKISKKKKIRKIGRHKAQAILLKDNAECTIIKPSKHFKNANKIVKRRD